MEEIVLKFRVEISMGGSQTYQVTSPLDWIVTENWFGQAAIPYHEIEIRTETCPPYPDFYADVAVRLEDEDDNLVLSKVSKGTWKSIKVRVEFEELLPFVTNTIKSIEELLGRFLNYTVQLSPILILFHDITYRVKSGINKICVKQLIEHITQLQESSDYAHLFDIVISSGDTSVKANKCILAARLPSFRNKLTETLQRRAEDGLEEIRIDPSAEPGLKEMIKFVYSNKYSLDIVPLGNLAVTAYVMGCHYFMLLILNEFIKKLSINNVLFAIYFTDLHGAKEHLKAAIEFLINNFEKVQATHEWNNVEVLYTLISLKGKDVLADASYLDILKLALKMHVKMSYML